MVKKIIPWIKISAATAISLILILGVLSFIFLKLNSVDRISTSLSYEFQIKNGSYEDLFGKILASASKNGLKRESGNSTSKQEARWVSASGYGVYIFSFPQQADAAPWVHVSIFNIEEKGAIEDGAWQRLAKEVEGDLLLFSNNFKVVLQLDPETYGECAPSSQQKGQGSICFFPLVSPVNFDEIHSKIMLPRKRS